MSTKLVLCCFLLSIIFCSCNSEFFELESDSLPEVPSPVDFQSLSHNQKSFYVRYQTTCDDVSSFQYTGDTLALEVIEDQGKLFLSEYFTSGSPLYQQRSGTIRYPITPINDFQILILERTNSTLFFFYGNDTLTLVPNELTELQQQDCLIMIDDGEIFDGDEIGTLDSFQLGPIQLQDKTVVSCIPIFFGLDAYLIYDRNQLYVSHVVESPQIVSGWVLLE